MMVRVDASNLNDFWGDHAVEWAISVDDKCNGLENE